MSSSHNPEPPDRRTGSRDLQLEIELLRSRTPEDDEGASAGSKRATEGLRVLVVDDDPEIREYVRRCLEREKSIALVIEAPDGSTALEAIRRDEVDLVMTDIAMPRLDGFGLYEALRRHDSHQSIPIVLVTGEHSFRDVEARLGGQLRNVAVLTKPFNCQELCQEIRSLLTWGGRRVSEDDRRG